MDNSYIQDLLAEAEASGSGGGGRYESQLSAAARDELGRFVEWLRDRGFSTASSSSYKSYVAKAQALHQSWKELTSDQRSAVRKFAEFLES